MGMFESGLKAAGGLMSAKGDAQRAKDTARRNREYVENLDFQPEFASDHAPTYQQAKSPLARAYLESILMGSNPATTFSGAPGADAKKLGQAKQKAQQFGFQSDLQKESAAERTATPWAVTSTPERQIGKTASGSGVRFANESKQYDQNGVTEDEWKDLNEKLAGNNIRLFNDVRTGKVQFSDGNKAEDMFNGMTDEQVQQLNSMYEGGAENQAIADYLEGLADAQKQENPNPKLGPKIRQKVKGWFTRD